MKRLSIIICGCAYNDKQKENMDKLASCYISFLHFPMGGAWESDEIIVLKEPILKDLELLISTQKPDYALIIFIGHGATRDDRQLFHLNKDTIVQAGQLSLDIPKQLIIIESCRSINNNISFVNIQNRTPKFAKGGLVMIREEEAKERFMNSLIQSNDGLVVCFACSNGEKALGLYFSNQILQYAQKWHETQKHGEVLTINDLMLKVTPLVKNFFTSKNKNQTPEIIGTSIFPFVINKW